MERIRFRLAKGARLPGSARSVALALLAVLGANGQSAPAPAPAVGAPASPLAAPNVAALARGLREISLDPTETYRVRDFRITRGDLRIYLSDGIISFTTPVGGRRTAAVFVTKDSEFGDAELLLLPPRRGEREALLHFTKTPNLDEHFDSAVFLFTDQTFEEVRQHMVANGIEASGDLTGQLGQEWNGLLRNLASDVEIRLLDALANRRATNGEFFDAVIGGRLLGAFDVIYDRESREAVALGRVKNDAGRPEFQLWSSFTPRRAGPSPNGQIHLSNYRIDTQIADDLHQSSETRVDVTTERPDTQAISFLISDRLKVTAALVDGEEAEVYQRNSVHLSSEDPALSPFLVVSRHLLTVREPHTFTIRAEGTVVRHEGRRGYYVADRNAWFPHRDPEAAMFDVTFRLPGRYRVVSIGELIDERVTNGERVMHRRTMAPARYAGFNLGEYEDLTVARGAYRIECFANRDLLMRGTEGPSAEPSAEPATPSPGAANGAQIAPGAGDDLVMRRLSELSARTGALLDRFTSEWGPLPIKTLAVSPIPAYIGQGFPGLVYLSSLAYLHEEERPAALRNPMGTIFFSDVLLAHEVAHQWWGNVVSPADYHSEWIFEALANIAALDLLEQNRGRAVRDQVLESFRADLLTPRKDGGVVESIGPIELGYRLRDMASAEDWHLNKMGFRLGDAASQEGWRIITYEKGTWILHMLRQRIGEDAFRQMLKRLATEYAGREIANEDFRNLAAGYLPPGAADPKLEAFFDAWVYGTGIPKLRLKPGPAAKGKAATREVAIAVDGVADDFVADVPITVRPKTGKPRIEWVRCTADGGSFDVPRDATAQLPAPEDFLYTVP